MMITAALVRPTRCSRSAHASARCACSRSVLLRSGGFLAHGGGGRRGPRRPLNGRHFGPPNDQFHDKLSRLYGSFGSSIGTSRVSALLSSEYEAISRRVSSHTNGSQPVLRMPAPGPGPPAIRRKRSGVVVHGDEGRRSRRRPGGSGSSKLRRRSRDYLRTRNRRMVTAPDRVLSSGSRSILARPGEEKKRVPSPSRTGRTNTMISSTSPRRRH
jgi:hypothetical protein